MPKLLSSEEIVKILANNGFVLVSQRGSHMKYRGASGETSNRSRWTQTDATWHSAIDYSPIGLGS